MLSLEDLFCSVDDFCQQFEPQITAFPVPKLLQLLMGKIFADKGSVSQKLAQLLNNVGVQLIT